MSNRTIVVVGLEKLPAAIQRVVEAVVPALGLELAKNTVRHLLRHIVEKSPVGDPSVDPHSGLYRDSHTVSVGKPVFREMPLLPSYPIPGDADADAGMADAEPGQALFVATEAKPVGAKRGYSDILEGGRRQYSRVKSQKTMWIGSEQASEGVYDPSVEATLDESATIAAEAIKATEQRI